MISDLSETQGAASDWTGRSSSHVRPVGHWKTSVHQPSVSNCFCTVMPPFCLYRGSSLLFFLALVGSLPRMCWKGYNPWPSVQNEPSTSLSLSRGWAMDSVPAVFSIFSLLRCLSVFVCQQIACKSACPEHIWCTIFIHPLPFAQFVMFSPL